MGGQREGRRGTVALVDCLPRETQGRGKEPYPDFLKGGVGNAGDLEVEGLQAGTSGIQARRKLGPEVWSFVCGRGREAESVHAPRFSVSFGRALQSCG